MVDLSGRTLGEFILRKPIGDGGYGIVYLAEQPALEREVVVKVLREDRTDPEAREGSSARPGSRRSSTTPTPRRSTRPAPRTAETCSG